MTTPDHPPAVEVHLHRDGGVTIDGAPIPTGHQDPAATAVAHLTALAARTGHPITAHAIDEAGHVTDLVIHPDGRTDITAPSPASAANPRREGHHPSRGATPAIPEPGHQPSPDPQLKSTIDCNAGGPPVSAPRREDAAGTPPPVPPQEPDNGIPHRRRLTPLDDPPAGRPTSPTLHEGSPATGPEKEKEKPPPAPIPIRRGRTPTPGPWDLFNKTPPRVSDPIPPAGSMPPPALPTPVPAAAMTELAPLLAPAGLLPRLRPTAARPTVGWQARVHTWTRGRWSPPLSAAETRHLDLVAAVQAPFTGPRLVAVVNPKGGAGKTPAVLATAATWGAHRGSVVAWDDNETRGTLAMRALADPRNPTVAGLLADLTRFDRPSARVGDLAAYLRPQGGARFDVLASDDDPTRMAQFGAAEFGQVRGVLARFYAITVVDTGNNVRAGNWQAAVDAADQLLLVSTYSRDAAVTASWTLDHLHATGRGRLAETAVTVLSAATPSTDRRTRTELRDHFTTRTRTVVEIPYDPVIADGEHLDLHALRPATRDAWLEATAALTQGLTR